MDRHADEQFLYWFAVVVSIVAFSSAIAMLIFWYRRWRQESMWRTANSPFLKRSVIVQRRAAKPPRFVDSLDKSLSICTEELEPPAYVNDSESEDDTTGAQAQRSPAERYRLQKALRARGVADGQEIPPQTRPKEAAVDMDVSDHTYATLPETPGESKQNQDQLFFRLYSDEEDEDDPFSRVRTSSEQPRQSPNIVIHRSSVQYRSSDELLCAATAEDDEIGRRLDSANDGEETPFSMNSSPIITVERLLGKLMVTAQYFPVKEKLEVNLREAFGLHLVEEGARTQVRLLLLPDKRERQKTKLIEGTDPRYDQICTFSGIHQEQLCAKSLRMRVYKRMGGGGLTHSRRDQLLGETLLPLCMIDARGQSATNHLLTLVANGNAVEMAGMTLSASDYSVNSRRNSIVDVNGRYCSSPCGQSAELLVSLCYEDRFSKLVVGIEKASCLFSAGSATPTSPNPAAVQAKTKSDRRHSLADTMVKITVVSAYGDEVGKWKSSTQKANQNPVFSDNAVFQLAHSELSCVSVLVQVYALLGVWRRRVLLGWLSLGRNSTTQFEEQHWHEMIQGMGTPVSKWHELSLP